MPEAQVFVSFYGSYMNRAVLAEVGLTPTAWEVASLPGFDIRMAPRAQPSSSRWAGRVRASWLPPPTASSSGCTRTLERVLGEVYLPEAVLARTESGAWRPALCYIAPHMAEKPADSAYVERILQPARDLGFPSWYLARLESFRP